ncbi:MAG: hypothetical protein AAGJ35_10780 [Myxococcota bacterium]
MSILKVAMRHAHVCVLLEDGTVRCWGANELGQLGYGDRTIRLKSGPKVNVGALKVQDVKTGFNHTCVLLEGGYVKCWGSNRVGQLGYPDTQIRLQPDSAFLDFQGRRVVQLSLGHENACVVLDDQSVRCWGSYPGQRSPGALKSPLRIPLFEPASQP